MGVGLSCHWHCAVPFSLSGKRVACTFLLIASILANMCKGRVLDHMSPRGSGTGKGGLWSRDLDRGLQEGEYVTKYGRSRSFNVIPRISRCVTWQKTQKYIDWTKYMYNCTNCHCTSTYNKLNPFLCFCSRDFLSSFSSRLTPFLPLPLSPLLLQRRRERQLENVVQPDALPIPSESGRTIRQINIRERNKESNRKNRKNRKKGKREKGKEKRVEERQVDASSSSTD